jgi:hypothetical protein
MFFSSLSFASTGLVIHTTEFGVGKFHRYDNQVHAYDHSSAWAPYVLPNGAAVTQPLIQKNADGSFTVFFSTLDDLIASVVQISDTEKRKVSVLNVHGHGLPGAMWFPKDQASISSFECSDWNDAANGSDQNNYSQYYSAVSVDEINQIKQMSDNPNIQTGCTTGLKEWQAGVAKTPHFKDVFADDAQIHFLSCVVGLGKMGEQFTQGIASLLLPKAGGRVETSMDFGLGDFSMPEGMGFWDYQSDAQIEHDNSIYVVDHKDREIAQKGTIRMATFTKNQWDTTLLSNRDFMVLSFESGETQGTPVAKESSLSSSESFSASLPDRIRVPGTTSYVRVRH